jgi:hypothetical protein
MQRQFIGWVSVNRRCCTASDTALLLKLVPIVRDVVMLEKEMIPGMAETVAKP